MGEFETKEDVSPEGRLLDILRHPEERILSLLSNSTNPQDQQAKQRTRTELIGIAKYLFREIEQTAKRYNEINNSVQKAIEGKKEEPVEVPPLSGLSELYVPESSDDGAVDVETIWGQVELQNNSLNKIVKKSIKRLSKSPEEIVVLDMGMLSSDEEDDDASEEISEEEDAMDDEGDDSADEDEEATRIRERMERAMEDVDSDDDSSEEDEDEEQPVSKAKQDDEKEELYDPVAEDMKDGFFNLIDMEDYADEEEDYLPREAYGETQNEKKKKSMKNDKKTFHQKQRDGDFLNRSDNDEDDDEDFVELYEEDAGPMERKKYRDDEDIEALYSLYQPANEEDSEAEDAANMTAAQFFGAPSKKHMERYQARRAKEEINGDDDSWGEYDFEQDHPDSDNDENDAEKNEDSVEEEEEENETSIETKSKKDWDEPKNSGEIKNRKVDNSRYTKQQEKLRQQTEQLESEMIAEKPWQMTGETKGTSRPVNSLLEGTPEFEFASKQAPTITIEHTTNLEDAIKKRILAEDWDDVVPRELPDVGWHKKRGELPEVSQEKSKLGLGELYEREYLKKAVGYDKDAEEKKTVEDKAKDEMKQLFANLCSKLDGLSNYHFAPRPIAEEVEVRAASTPAIAMEEVLPLHVNDARAVAPEEIYATKRGREGVLRGETEMDQQERKRLRQSKKTVRRKERKEKLADEKLISRLEPGLGLNNPYEKRKMREELAVARSKGKVTTGEKELDGKYGSSGTFFQRLQAEAKQTIMGKSSGEEERRKKTKPKSSSLKL